MPIHPSRARDEDLVGLVFVADEERVHELRILPARQPAPAREADVMPEVAIALEVNRFNDPEAEGVIPPPAKPAAALPRGGKGRPLLDEAAVGLDVVARRPEELGESGPGRHGFTAA